MEIIWIGELFLIILFLINITLFIKGWGLSYGTRMTPLYKNSKPIYSSPKNATKDERIRLLGVLVLLTLFAMTFFLIGIYTNV